MARHFLSTILYPVTITISTTGSLLFHFSVASKHLTVAAWACPKHWAAKKIVNHLALVADKVDPATHYKSNYFQTDDFSLSIQSPALSVREMWWRSQDHLTNVVFVKSCNRTRKKGSYATNKTDRTHFRYGGLVYYVTTFFLLLLLWCALLFWVIKMSAVTFKNGKKAKAYIVIRCHAAISHKKAALRWRIKNQLRLLIFSLYPAFISSWSTR